MYKSDLRKTKELQDKIQTAVSQAVLQVMGPNHSLRVISNNVEVGDLLPQGVNLSLKMSIDIYEKDA